MFHVEQSGFWAVTDRVTVFAAEEECSTWNNLAESGVVGMFHEGHFTRNEGLTGDFLGMEAIVPRGTIWIEVDLGAKKAVSTDGERRWGGRSRRWFLRVVRWRLFHVEQSWVGVVETCKSQYGVSPLRYALVEITGFWAGWRTVETCGAARRMFHMEHSGFGEE